MTYEFSDYISQIMLVYLDEILVYNKSWKEHQRHIRKLLQRLRETKLYGKKEKCTFGVEKAEYL